MLYVYIIISVIYPGTRLVLGSVPVWFGCRNIGTFQIFEGLGPVFQVISVRFFLSRPICVEQILRT